MKISKKLTLNWFILCLVLQFGGCSLMSSNVKQPPTANNSIPKENDTTVDKRDEINANIKQIKKEIEKIEDKQENEIRKVINISDKNTEIGLNALTQANSKCPVGKTSNPPECKDFSTAKKELDKKKGDLTIEEKRLENLPIPTSIPIPTPKPKEFLPEDLGGMLLWLISGIIGLAVLGGSGFLIYRIISKSLREKRREVDGKIHNIKLNNDELRRKVNELTETVRLQSSQSEQVRTSLKSLQKQILDLGGQNVQPQAVFTPPVYQPEPKFPTAAEDYCNKSRHNAQTATADLFGGLLIHDDGKGNEFLIVRDGDLADGQFYAVPNQARFSTKGDYFSYFQNYYDCENPSSGTIWIKSPAVVNRVENGWTLARKGELEVRN